MCPSVCLSVRPSPLDLSSGVSDRAQTLGLNLSWPEGVQIAFAARSDENFFFDFFNQQGVPLSEKNRKKLFSDILRYFGAEVYKIMF